MGRNVANVWGKGGLNQTPAPVPAPSPGQNIATASSQPFSPTSSQSNPYGPYGSTSITPATPEVAEKSPEMIEKERMAAALFGGIVPGAVATPSPLPPSVHSSQTEPVAMASHDHPPAPAPAPVPAPAPAPAPEIDLLDFDFSPTPVVPVGNTSDIFPSMPQTDDLLAATSISSTTPNTPTTFIYNTHPLNPISMPTTAFGQKWVSSPHISTQSHPSSLQSAIDFMAMCEVIGLAKVEVISATNEAIASAQLEGVGIVLVHGKVGQGKVDVTVKSEGITGDVVESLNNFIGVRAAI